MTEQYFNTKVGKDLKNIGSAYNLAGYVRIYDLQLTELHAENLIEDSGEIRVTAQESDVYSNVKRTIPGKYAAGDKFTVNVGSIENLAGSAVEYSVFLYQAAEGGTAYVSNSEILSKEGRIAVFTLNDSYNPDTMLFVVFYAGRSGETSGNDVAYRNVMLVEGEYTSETMPAYCPKWIPAAADLAVEAEQVQLPAEYRPATQGETEDGEYDLCMRMPNYTTRVVTPWGDDKEVVMIPPGVKLFPAWIQVDTPQGTLEEPEKYFSADWGNGLKGMQVLLDAEQIGTGTMVVEPEVHEDLSMARYRCDGEKGVLIASGDATQLEDFEEGTKVVFECVKNEYSVGTSILSVKKNNEEGVYFTKGGSGLNVIVNGKYKGVKTGSFSRIEVVLNAEHSNVGITVDGIPVKNDSNWIDATGLSSTNLNFYDGVCLVEIYSPDGTLLHRWDFEGATDEERLADKAATDNPINLTKVSGFKLTPI